MAIATVADQILGVKLREIQLSIQSFRPCSTNRQAIQGELRRDRKARVQDILRAIAAIQTYTEALTLDAFLESPMVIQAVLYNYVVMNEAVRGIPSDVKAETSSIPWRHY